MMPEQRALVAETFLFRGAGREPLEFALSDPRCAREETAKGAVIYGPRAFRDRKSVV